MARPWLEDRLAAKPGPVPVPDPRKNRKGFNARVVVCDPIHHGMAVATEIVGTHVERFFFRHRPPGDHFRAAGQVSFAYLCAPVLIGFLLHRDS